MNNLLKVRPQWQLPGRLALPLQNLRHLAHALAHAPGRAIQGGNKAVA